MVKVLSPHILLPSQQLAVAAPSVPNTRVAAGSLSEPRGGFTETRPAACDLTPPTNGISRGQWALSAPGRVGGAGSVGGGSRLPPDTRAEQYQQFIHQSVSSTVEHFQDLKQDRGLIVSPLGLRDMAQELLRQVVEQGGDKPMLSSLEERRILLVVQGIENRERWRRRLERMLAITRKVGHREKDLWEKNGITIELASIHHLSRLSKKHLQQIKRQTGLIILDQEHHIRPVEDKGEDSERQRFIRLLVETDFLTGTFERIHNEHCHLLGLTETVTDGAGRIYGGARGLIVAHTLPELLARGFINKPEVRVIVPQSFPNHQGVHAIWKNLSPPERIAHTIGIIDALAGEARSEQLPRLVVYTGSREEAQNLAHALEARPRYRDHVTLMISGDKALNERRTRDYWRFMTGIRNIAIHVETMLEGVDEFRDDPVDGVIYGGVEYAGSLHYALRAVGAHLGTSEKVPLMIDQAGLFTNHPDLTSFDPTPYVLEDGEIKPGHPVKRLGLRRTYGRQKLQDEDKFSVDLFGAQVGRSVRSLLHRIAPNVSRARLALAMNCPEEVIDQIWSGRFVPAARIFMENLAKALRLERRHARQLLLAWALDRVRPFNQKFPVPAELSSAETTVLLMVRTAFALRYGGNYNAVPGTTPKTFKAYMERGALPLYDNSRRVFFSTLTRVLSSREDIGMKYLIRHLGLGPVADYWRPSSIDALGEITMEHIRGWFDVVAHGRAERPARIVWQFRTRDDHLGSSTVAAVGEEFGSDQVGKLLIEDHGGHYEIVRAWGTGSAEVLGRLRSLDRSYLSMRSDGWVVDRRALRLEELSEIRRSDFEGWFDEVTRRIGRRPQRISLRLLVGSSGKTISVYPLVPGEEKRDRNHGSIVIRDHGDHYEVMNGRGYGARTVCDRLRKLDHPWLDIRSNKWIVENYSLQIEDLRELRLTDIEGWFDEVEKRIGHRPQRIVWQFRPDRKNTLLKRSPQAEGEENDSPDYGKLLIEDRGDHYEIVRAWGAGSIVVVNELRALGRNYLRMRANGWISVAYTLRLEELDEIRRTDLEGWFDTVERRIGRRPRRIVWEFQIRHNHILEAPAAVAVGEENSSTRIGKLFIEDRGDHFEMVKAQGSGGAPVLSTLRALDRPYLRARADGWVRESRALRLADLQELRITDIEGWFEEVARRTGKRPRRIVWQFRIQRKDNLYGSTLLAVGEESGDKHYGKLLIEDRGGHFAILAAKGKDARNKVVATLAKLPITQGKNPKLRIEIPKK